MKFSIRDLLWFTAVVALAVAWWVDHGASKAREQESRHDAEVLVKNYSGSETDEVQAVLRKYGWEY